MMASVRQLVTKAKKISDADGIGGLIIINYQRTLKDKSKDLALYLDHLFFCFCQ